jgi:hypothetical protein
MTDHELLESIESQLKGFATKDDLKHFATKDDFKHLEAIVSGIGDRLAVVADTMATNEDVNELKEYIDDSLDACVDDVELRLGRRIDNLLKPSNKRKLRKLIAAKL